MARGQQKQMQDFVGDARSYANNSCRKGGMRQGKGADAKEGQGMQGQFKNIL